MAELLTFSNYIDDFLEKNSAATPYRDKALLTVDIQYKNYINWLVLQNIEQASVSDLLLQIQIISAYVEHKLKDAADNTSLIRLTSVPNENKDNAHVSQNLEQILQSHFNKSDELINENIRHVAKVHLGTLSLLIFIVSGIFGGAMIGFSFLRHTPLGLVAYHAALGGLCTAYALYHGITAIKINRLSPEEVYTQNRESLRTSNVYKNLLKGMIDSTIVDPSIETNDNKADESVSAETTTALTEVIGTKDAPCGKAIAATLYAGTKTRYAPLYSSEPASVDGDKFCPGIAQPVDLSVIQLQPKPKNDTVIDEKPTPGLPMSLDSQLDKVKKYKTSMKVKGGR